MGPENSNAGISDPLCSVSSNDEGAKIQPHLSPRVGKVEVAESGSAGDAGQGCEPSPSSPGFYSRLFLVPNNGGQWRPIIDLSALNAFIDCPSFTMETPRSILRALRQGQWLTSLDLKDAYFQIGIHPDGSSVFVTTASGSSEHCL